ncbi:hypothetical protein Tco_0871398 [Tanacetum coccineum]
MIKKLFHTLYESITLDQEAFDAQDAEPSFHKSSCDYQDPPNNHEGENRKKRRKDVGEPSSRSSRKDKSPVERPNAGWLKKKSGSANAKDLLLKSKIDQNENHILGPSTVAMEKKLKELIQKDEFTIANLEAVLTEARWNSGEGDMSKPRSF